MSTLDVDWTTNYGEIVAFGRVLAEVGEFITLDDLLYYFEKPHKWSNDHESWVAAGRPQMPEAMDWNDKRDTTIGAVNIDE
jgi:hypothetical protein